MAEEEVENHCDLSNAEEVEYYYPVSTVQDTPCSTFTVVREILREHLPKNDQEQISPDLSNLNVEAEVFQPMQIQETKGATNVNQGKVEHVPEVSNQTLEKHECSQNVPERKQGVELTVVNREEADQSVIEDAVNEYVVEQIRHQSMCLRGAD